MATPITVYGTIAELDASVNPRALAGVSSTVKDQALKRATGDINSALPAQFVLPLTAVGPCTKGHCLALAVMYALGGRGYNPEGGGDPFVEKMYDSARAWLKDVSKGTATPDVTDSREAVAGVPHNSPVVISSSQRGFTNRGTSSRAPFQGD
jgi:phage gp36-like protein